ncbi:hypothetical protein LTR56_017190 [Elasticomyces elasticus]|nr:hypothetical protein LTR56_017190 [Elasticomyces elasticus]KAK3666306.1 hypothetical protein LTR22_002970 [Elasticomyces elasticus]KAK4926902.1 hypothetical protein LTR49_006318 [Elasticomyces elasticus]KAK5752667.1 hypothetical protein LTS12_017236 [Elasticomyces elasticus]
MAAVDDRTEHLAHYANRLGVKRDDYARRDFFTLARAWLLRYSAPGILPLTCINNYPPAFEITTILEDAALAFLSVFGPRMWPPMDRASERTHLQPDAWQVYERDARNVESEVRVRRLPDRPREYYEARFCYSELRLALSGYFKLVGRVPYDPFQDGRIRETVDELFARVIGREVGGYPVEPEEQHELEA